MLSQALRIDSKVVAAHHGPQPAQLVPRIAALSDRNANVACHALSVKKARHEQRLITRNHHTVFATATSSAYPKPHMAPVSKLGQLQSTFCPSEVDGCASIIFGYRRDFHSKYEMINVIGSGGFGVVWRAKELSSGEEYAVKVMQKADLVTREKFERVKAEVLYQSTMRPSLSVACLFDVFEDDERVLMVMELCHGGTLWDRMKEGSCDSEAKAVKIIQLCLQAVAQCHASGIMLRDVKPHNFLFLNDEEDSPLKLTDFGLAAYFSPGLPDEEPFTERLGTSTYMAPEVVGRLTSWPPEVRYGPRADVWSIGVMAYQLLCGKLPYKFDGKDDSQPLIPSADIFGAIVLGELDFDSPRFQSLSEGARDFLRQLLKKDSEQRPAARNAVKLPWLSDIEGEKAFVPVVSHSLVDILQPHLRPSCVSGSVDMNA